MLADNVPVHKSKEKYFIDKYRPISLLLTISKLLEKSYIPVSIISYKSLNKYTTAYVISDQNTLVPMQYLNY